MPCIIHDAAGKVIQTSRNLRGVRAYSASNAVRKLEIFGNEHGAGVLSIVFENGATFCTDFVSFEVLKGFVARWRNVHGAPLFVNGVESGAVSSKNAALVEPYTPRDRRMRRDGRA